MKASFNLNSIMSLVAQHVEKVVLGLVCLFALVLVYGGVAKSRGLDWEPSKLETESASAEQSIDSREPGVGGLDPRPKAKEIIAALKICKTPVEEPPYDHPKPWVATPFDQSSKRVVPTLFAVEDLRAAAGWGAVNMTPPTEAKAAARGPAARRRGTIGQRWVVLTGAIPFAKQQTAYEQAFKDAYKDPTKDVPSYLYYYVERAEVDPLGSATEIKWSLLNTKVANSITDFWNGRQPEIIDRVYLLPMASNVPMAFPLPPVTNRPWGPEIAHEPDIPFYQEVDLTSQRMEDIPGLDKEDTPDVPGAVVPGRLRGGQGMMDAGMMDAGMMDAGMMDAGMMDMGMGGRFPGMGMGGQLAGEPITVRLFRFFDFSVVPGKHYRYRVRLLLVNPNQGVPPKYLEDVAQREAKYLETEFCDPTDVVTVPMDSRLLCVNVKSSVNVSVEPSAHMMSVHFDPETGEESAAEHDKLFRGQFANFFDLPVKAASKKPAGFDGPAMMGGAEAEMGMMEMMMNAGQGGRQTADRDRRRDRQKKAGEEEEEEKVNHLTEHLLVDFHGGQRLNRELIRPCSVLLLDPAGRLVVRSDLDDLEEYLTYYVPEEKPRKGPEENMMEGMEGMMDGMMEGPP